MHSATAGRGKNRGIKDGFYGYRTQMRAVSVLTKKAVCI